MVEVQIKKLILVSVKQVDMVIWLFWNIKLGHKTGPRVPLSARMNTLDVQPLTSTKQVVNKI